ncbi:MAG: DUF222 domain-containing protein [Nocardioides sp.]
MSRHLDGTGTGHPITGFLDLLEAGLDDLATIPAWSLDAGETTEVITRIEADLARLTELEARALRQASTLDLPGQIGARSLAVWLARMTRLTKGEAHRRTKLAETLARHDLTRDAVAKGDVLAEQAMVIGAAVADLGEEHSDQRVPAEEHLVEKAADFDAHALRELGRRLVEVVDPEGADEYEAKKLAELEARARKRTELRMWDDGEGLSHGRFTLPQAQGAMLRKALQALASPKHVRATEGAGAYDYEKPTPQKLGWAFAEYIERFPADRLAQMGGLAATVVVTAEADIFTRGTQRSGRTDAGVKVSPGQLLRWACEAKIIPAVLDKQGHVLDLGRSHRLHTPAQRLAIIVAQKVCQHPTCETLGAFCHVHHTHPWSSGGETNTRDAVLLCPFHHHQAHAQHIEYPIRT